MKNYTVLLLRPDYIASQYGEDTWLAHVEAETVLEAQEAAQREVWEADAAADDDYAGDDYLVLFVAEGHIDNLAVGDTPEGETR